MILIGGLDADKAAYSDRITEISLVQPYSSKPLATIPKSTSYHGIAIFCDKILIVGGIVTGLSSSTLRSFVMYDIIKKECQGLAPLPLPVHNIDTLK